MTAAMALRFARDLGFSHVTDGFGAQRLSTLIRVYEATESNPYPVDMDDTYTVTAAGDIERVTLAGARVRAWTVRGVVYENAGPERLACLLCSSTFATSERRRHEATPTHRRMTR